MGEHCEDLIEIATASLGELGVSREGMPRRKYVSLGKTMAQWAHADLTAVRAMKLRCARGAQKWMGAPAGRWKSISLVLSPTMVLRLKPATDPPASHADKARREALRFARGSEDQALAGMPGPGCRNST